MRIVYAGIEIISIPAYAHVAMRVQIILYALPVATLAQVYIVNQPLVEQKNNKELDSIFTHSRPVAPFFFGWQLQVMQLYCDYSDCTNMTMTQLFKCDHDATIQIAQTCTKPILADPHDNSWVRTHVHLYHLEL